ncbi:MAG: S41 family peptidase [Candidatus Pacebacteria bacterium]|nr:S41 family peptidase [Candidatus Paceibacterota bacterium]
MHTTHTQTPETGDTNAEAPSTTPTEQRAARWSLLGVGLAVLFASATFFSGFHMGSGARLEASIGSWFVGAHAEESSSELGEFWNVWQLLEDKFVSATTSDALTHEEKIWGAIGGLVDSYGDPYTVYLPPEDAEMFDEDISGNFSGVGMEVGIRDDVLTVIAPLPDTPAEQAGLHAGDRIVKIDDTTTDGMSIDAAVRLIRGARGTDVVLTIYRKGDAEFTEITVTRDTITIPTIKTETREGVFIISLYSFNALADSEMQRALRDFVRSDATKLVLDVRGNPGGFLQSAVSIASYFLSTGTVVVRESFGEGLREDVYRSNGRVLGSFAPEAMVVLIDGGSASASEILAGALSEHGVATLIGAQTFGKGSVQELVELKDGSSLKVTVARWLTPEGVSISEAGLTPDIEVERTPDDRMNDIDPQLDEAINFLNR